MTCGLSRITSAIATPGTPFTTPAQRAGGLRICGAEADGQNAHLRGHWANICAHHARLWNRECRIKPIIANAFRADLTPNDRIYAQLVVMQILLAKIAPGNHWAQKLRDLLAEHPAIPIISMGFPADWQRRRVWGLVP
jgi:hypothetical protein